MNAALFDRRLGTLRVEEALRYKAPYLLTIVYFYFFLARPSLRDALTLDALALCTLGGIAGFGYFSNDVADRAEDRTNGKRNDAATLTTAQLAGALFLLAFLALLPWFVFFPLDRITVSLLVAEFALLVAYVCPPFRLKERGLAGVGADALYAHALPALIAANTLFLMTPYDHPLPFAASLAIWQLPLGARNIIHHQMADFDADRASGTRTYVSTVGGTRALRFVERTLTPIEVAGFVSWLTVVSFTMPAVGLAFIVHCIARRARSLTVASRWDAMSAYADAFCLVWMPLVAIGVVGATNPPLIVLGVVHVILFRRPLHESIVTLWSPSVPAAQTPRDDVRP